MGHNNEKKIERAARNAQWIREQQDKAEALPIIESFNAKLEAGRDPFFMPTIRAALITGRHWLIVVCRSCGTVIDLDLRVRPRPAEATILIALRDVRCPRCNGHGRPGILRLSEGPTPTVRRLHTCHPGLTKCADCVQPHGGTNVSQQVTSSALC